MSKRISEMIKFVFTGGVCFLIEYAALILFKEWLGLGVLIASPLAFLLSVVVNYILCVRWVFPAAKGGGRKAQLGFLLTSLMGLVQNWLIMWILTAIFGEDKVLFTVLGFSVKVYMVNKVIATLEGMIWNYFTKRYVLKG